MVDCLAVQVVLDQLLCRLRTRLRTAVLHSQLWTPLSLFHRWRKAMLRSLLWSPLGLLDRWSKAVLHSLMRRRRPVQRLGLRSLTTRLWRQSLTA